MDTRELERIVKERRSIRRWKKEEIPDDLVRKAIELATWAPNGGNYQGWRFVAVKNKNVIEKMANAVQSVVDLMASWPEAKAWPEDVRRYQENASFFRNASVCIGVFITEYQSVADKLLNARLPMDQKAREILAFRKSAPTGIQSAAAAVATMLLVFHQMGLGAIWLAAPVMAKKEIENILKVPGGMNLICLVAVGYSDEFPQVDRKPVDDVLEFVR